MGLAEVYRLARPIHRGGELHDAVLNRMRRRRDSDYWPRGENGKLVVYSISAEEWRERRFP